MHCLISVVIRQWTAVFEEAQAYKRQMLDASAALGIARPPALARARGFLVVVDWDAGAVLGGLGLAKPCGFLLDQGQLRVALWGEDAIATLVGGDVVGHVRHPWFNHLHTLDRTERGLLVSSSGTDLIAEVDETGALVWDCFMFERGYADRRLRLGQAFRRDLDYNGRYLPASLSTHPNSAILVDGDVVLATLFTTGELVRIDRRTGEVAVVLAGLRRPHAIRRRDGGFMLCDTEGGHVVLLGPELQVERRVSVAAPWIQDAVLAGERMLVVGNRRILMGPLRHASGAGDGDNYVIALRGGHAEKRLSFGPDSRIYMAQPIARRDAEALAHAWRRDPFDASELRWESA